MDTEVCDVKRPNKAGYTPAMLAALAYVQSDEHREIIRRLFSSSAINAQAAQVGFFSAHSLTCCYRYLMHVSSISVSLLLKVALPLPTRSAGSYQVRSLSKEGMPVL